jgi:nitrate/nitrite transporter NarK
MLKSVEIPDCGYVEIHLHENEIQLKITFIPNKFHTHTKQTLQPKQLDSYNCMSYPTNEIVRNFSSVAFGVLAGFLTAVPLLYITVIITGGTESLGAVTLFIFIGILIPSFIGGLTCGYISTRRDYWHVFITALVLIFLLSLNNDFKFTIPTWKVLFIFILIIASTFIGGFAGIKIKRKLY